MKTIALNLSKKIVISLNSESVWDNEIHNFGERYFGFFTSKSLLHNWVTKNNKEKCYEVHYRFGINLIWFKVWFGYSITKEYLYSIKQKKNKTEIFWDI